jgi:hypothetical protein
MGGLVKAVTGVLVLAVAAPAGAQFGLLDGSSRSKAQGGIVLRDDAPVYESKSSMEVKRTFDRGDVVVGLHKEMISYEYELFRENGRYRVGWPKKDSARLASGWMDTDDVVGFVYDCGCENDCIPLKASFKRAEWNPCFQEAADFARARLAMPMGSGGNRGGGDDEAAENDDGDDDEDEDDDGDDDDEAEDRDRPSAPAASAGEALSNDDVVAMVLAGLGDELVIMKIEQAPEERLDVSTDALIKLKELGVSQEVLGAMVKRVARR